ncbi:unnamed protein product [Brachionus calyciflorus]|uniref:Uncharacterized protein n=1 Tax=Brachionus calyciflorus TaxID=104777 RepID=A0A813YYX9_9BILA|nr:unnamed protein product [Brachionus calyciflorus]
MRKILAIGFFVLVCLNLIQTRQIIDALSDDDQNERELEDGLIEREEANEFFKRTLFHPFSTKNEEIKRETREVYEEKCESIIPFQRFCPEIKRWKAFKDYENGE